MRPTEIANTYNKRNSKTITVNNNKQKQGANKKKHYQLCEDEKDIGQLCSNNLTGTKRKLDRLILVQLSFGLQQFRSKKRAMEDMGFIVKLKLLIRFESSGIKTALKSCVVAQQRSKTEQRCIFIIS